jgi:uncharacterized membrane protein
MARSARAPFNLGRLELAAGLILMTAALLVVLDGVVGIVNSGCTGPPSNAATESCWGTTSGYFVVLGVILYAVGLILSIVGGFRKSTSSGVSTAEPR